MSNTGKNRLILFLILTLAFMLRFWHFSERYGIGYDGSRDAIVSFESKRQLQLPLTGSFSSIGPITFGPWYYYYITFANFIIPSAWAPWMMIGLSSLAMVFFIYKIGALLQSQRLGLIMAFLSAISPAQVVASTSLQQHALVGFFSSIAIYIFLKLYEPKSTARWFILMGFVIGVAINTHYQAVGLLTLPFLFFLFKGKLKSIPSLLIGLLISMLPLLFFELNNHWFNTRNIIDYLRFGQYRVWTSNRWLTYLFRFWPEFASYVLGIPFLAGFLVLSFSAVLFAYKFIRKKLALPYILILISFAVQVTILRYYRGEKFFGYLQFFHPYIFILTAFVPYHLFRKIRNTAILGLSALFIIVVFNPSFQIKPYDDLNKETTARLILLQEQYPGNMFSTYECADIYDIDHIQALTLLLYMRKLYSIDGRKIAILNKSCNNPQMKLLALQLIYLQNVKDSELKDSGLKPITPQGIYTGTARWWFKKQP